ncbi:MAG: beta-ketoacyl-[acyl-carrier-protein] synthase family protein [Verrucomicrobiae bacterium]|nr:beta-ketoacyl-[acyl-carrier-protein] synthase family protein [Verrucomicrobiae bacterium]
MSRRVVITGLGAFTAIGTCVEEFWRGCLEARSVVAEIPPKWSDFHRYNSRVWSPLPPLAPSSDLVNDIERTKLDAVAVLAMETAAEALRNAGVRFSLVDVKRNSYALAGVDADRTGVFVGTGVGGISSLLSNAAYHMLSPQQPRLQQIAKSLASSESHLEALQTAERIAADILIPFRPNPFVVSMIMPNAVSSNVAIKFGIHGPVQTNCSACSAGTVAIGQAFLALRSGNIDMAIAGGVEHLNDDYGMLFRGFDAARTLVVQGKEPLRNDQLNRPFDRDRSGFLFSQGGCGIMVLEELEHARARKADVICELAAYAETCDGFNIMMIEPNGRQIERMLTSLLQSAGCAAQDVDYVNAHGTGTQLNDATEAEVIERVFGQKVLVNSTKSLLGHTIGASGALGAIVAALSIRDGTTHVCKNLDHPIRDLNFVRSSIRQPIRTAVAQSFAFGGHNAALLMRAAA